MLYINIINEDVCKSIKSGNKFIFIDTGGTPQYVSDVWNKQWNDVDCMVVDNIPGTKAMCTFYNEMVNAVCILKDIHGYEVGSAGGSVIGIMVSPIYLKHYNGNPVCASCSKFKNSMWASLLENR